MGDKRTLSTKLRQSVDDLFDQGITDTTEIVDRLNGKINAQQVGGLLTLWKRRMNGTAGFNGPRRAPHVAPAPPAPPGRPDERIEAPGGAAPRLDTSGAPAKQAQTEKSSTPATDPFDFGNPETVGSESLGFGQALIEYHLRRLGPALMGFLGVEGDPINEDIIGRKHGGGDYEVTKYQNGNRYGYPKRFKISEAVYGPPKNARPAGATYPRLRAGAEDDPSAEPRDRAPHRSGSGELNETVMAFKALNEIVKENKDAGRTDPASAENKIVDRALELAMGKGGAPQGGENLIIAFYQQQESKRDAEAKEAEARWKREQDAREAEFARQQQAEKDRRAADMAEIKARHEQETTRIRTEAAERAASDKTQRDFFERIEKEREARQQREIKEMKDQLSGVHSSLAEEAGKERAHQQELAKAREETLKIERERLHAEIQAQKVSNDRLFDFQKSSNEQMYQLQMKAAGAGGDKGTEMIVEVIKDAVGKADARAHEIAEVKKLEKIIQTVGPENAKLLAMQMMTGGGIDLASILGGKKGAPAAAGGNGAPADPAAGGNGQGGAAPGVAPQGGLMNGIMQQTIESPFFKDLLEIWGGHLRMKRAPYLFANVMTGFMLEDKRVELFYDYMAGKTWDELLAEFKGKVKPEQVAFFEAPEAGKFFDGFIDLIAKRIERDHVQSGIVAGQPSAEAPAQ